MCTMRALVACTILLLVTGNSALPYSNTVYDEFLKARFTQSGTCEQNLRIDDGSVSYSATPSTEGSTASYTCKEGFRLLGQQTRPCGFSDQVPPNGAFIWLGNTPQCIQNCEQNLNIDHGTVTYSATPSTTDSTASFVCDNGNDPIGESTLTCETSGRGSSWSGNPPTCVPNCEQNLSIDRGSVTYSAMPSTEGSTASIECEDGNELNGDRTLTCEFNSQTGTSDWSGVFPTCVPHCEQNLDIDNGRVTYSATPSTAGSTASFECDSNIELDGESTLTCEFNSESGTSAWNGIPPTCTPTCEQNLRIANGIVSYSDTPSIESSTASYTCNQGFTLEGQQTRSCGFSDQIPPDGAFIWLGNTPRCVPTCEQNLSIDRGRVTYSATPSTEGSTASIECEDGNELNGDRTLTCEFNSQTGTSSWSGVFPTCVPHCDQNLSIDNGRVTYSATPSTAGSTASFECDSNIELDGESTLTCEFNSESGTSAWNGIPPTCTPTCEQNLRIDNGIVSYSATPSIESSTASYTCNQGFILQGEQTRSCGFSDQIPPDGAFVWLGNTPRCVPTCEQNLDIERGRVTYSATPSTEGSTASIECEDGNELNGDRTLTCEFNSQTGTSSWSGVLPTCVPHCDQNLSIERGTVTYSATPSTAGSTASFECGSNIELEGESTLTCEFNSESGTSAWSGNPPTCTPTCEQNLRIANGRVSYSATPSTERSTASYTCNQGFTLEGVDTRSCGFSDQIPPDGAFIWLGNTPRCIPNCQQNLNIDNGVVTYSATPSVPDSTASFRCNGNHVLSGRNTLTCVFDSTTNRAEWNGEPPTCELLCGRLDGTIPNGFAQPSALTRRLNLIVSNAGGVIIGWRPNAVAEYRCNQGYELVPRNGRRICRSDGTWSPQIPSCIASECPRLGEKAYLRDKIYGNTYDEVIKTLQKNHKGTVVEQPFANRKFNGFQEGDRFTVTCVNGWKELVDANHDFPGFETCVMRNGKLEWTRTNTCFYTFPFPVYGSNRNLEINPSLNE